MELSPEDEARADCGLAVIMELKHHWRAAQDSDLAFIVPVKGRLAGRLGVRRFFNEEPRIPMPALI